MTIVGKWKIGKSPAAPVARSNIIPHVAGAAILLQTADATATATAVPAIAAGLHVGALDASFAITAYLIGTACVAPAGGWMEERFGARRVFIGSILATLCASLACALAPTMTLLAAFRFLGGATSAVMLPVGRLMVFRASPRNKLIDAMATFATFALVGPICGPLLGGALVSFAGWRAVYLINVPLGLLILVAVLRYAADDRQASPRPIDIAGIVLSGAGLALAVLGMEWLGQYGVDLRSLTALAAAGALLVLFVRHVRRAREPIVHLELLERSTFRLSIIADSLARLLVGSSPMLVAMLLQIGFGWSPLIAGLVLMGPAAGSLTAKLVVPRLLRRFGFRATMAAGAVTSGGIFASLALCSAQTPYVAAFALLTLFGLTRSMIMSGAVLLGFDDIAQHEMGSATSLISVLQQMSLVVGIGLATMLLRMAGGGHVDAHAVHEAIVILGFIACLAMIAPCRLPDHAGRSMRGVAME